MNSGGALPTSDDTGAPPIRINEDLEKSYGNYLNARLAASQHDMANAAKFYMASLDADPNNPDLLARAFLYTVTAGDMNLAPKLAARVIANEPDNRVARTTLAVQAIGNKKYSEARDQLSKSAQGPFAILTIKLLSAWSAVGQSDIDTALNDLESLKAEGGTNSLIAFHRALVLDLAGRENDAEISYREAMKTSGNGPRIVEAYGRFLERNGREGEAKEFYGKLASDTALQPIVQAAQKRMESGKKPDALIASPQDGAAEAMFSIAASLTDDSSADVSVLYLRYARYLRPEFDLADILLADRLEAMEKFDEAIDVYHAIPKSSPYRRVAMVQAAVDEARLDRNDKAIADLKEVVSGHPDDSEAWTALGDVYRGIDKYAEAADAYDKAIAIRGSSSADSWPLLYARAVSYEQSGRWSLAEADLKAALKLSPQEPQLLNYLGYSWVDKGENLSEALGMLEKARALRPFDGYIADSVGWAYYRLGRYKDAAKTLQSAILLVPGDPTINDHLGDAYWRIGRKLDAQFQWNHALTFGAEGDEKAKIEAKLKYGLSGAGKS
ncbi:MAG TPA: tetratricopeptide repeat protein [Rhizomicrobium sp.]|nr:tetratricopeptide repeat protein [Rhizomicrobium sp.]